MSERDDAHTARRILAQAQQDDLDAGGEVGLFEIVEYAVAQALAAAHLEGAKEAEERAAALEAILHGIKWRSADKDNMEFAARITYVQMDAIRAALARSATGEEG